MTETPPLTTAELDDLVVANRTDDAIEVAIRIRPTDQAENRTFFFEIPAYDTKSVPQVGSLESLADVNVDLNGEAVADYEWESTASNLTIRIRDHHIDFTPYVV